MPTMLTTFFLGGTADSCYRYPSITRYPGNGVLEEVIECKDGHPNYPISSFPVDIKIINSDEINDWTNHTND